jgi:hypothetical protein
MDLDTNFDGIPDQTYSAGSVPLGLLGTGIGLGGFGGGTMDNFAAQSVPEPSTLWLGSAGLGLVLLSMRRQRR